MTSGGTGHKGLSQETTELYNKMLPLLNSRQHQLMSEFSFWPSSPPRDSGFPDGGIFEMRTYQLQPGKLFDWEAAWRRGLEARRRFVVRSWLGAASRLRDGVDDSNQSVRSSRRSGSCTRCTISGNTRKLTHSWNAWS